MSEKSNTASDRILAQIRTTPGETVDQMIGRVRQELLDENPPTWYDHLPPEEAAPLHGLYVHFGLMLEGKIPDVGTLPGMLNRHGNQVSILV